MIRAIRPSAMAQDDASLIAGWNVSPNVGYTVVLAPGATACGVLLFDADMTALVASGAGLVGTAQPVILLPQTGQTIGMVDAELGWHLLLTTTGTEAQQTIRIGTAVDLPDEIHPIYTDDGMALARATAAINAGASYVDDVTVTCPLGLGASIGDVASVPVDGVAVVGQVESVTWAATPDGATTQAVIRRHTAIAPEAPIAPPTPPVVTNDTAETDAATPTSGNVLTNDQTGLIVVAVNGLSVNVGQVVTGSNGGEFVINADGSWTFDPTGDFAELSGADTAETSVTYHASDGVSESSATLTVTVGAAVGKLWTPAEVTTELWQDAADEATITLNGSTVSQWSDKSGNGRHATQATASKQPERFTSGVRFDGTDDEMRLENITSLVSVNMTMFIVAKRDNSAGRAEISFAIGQASTANGICDVPKWTDNKMYSQVGRNANRPSPISVISDVAYQNCVTGGSLQKAYTNGVYLGAGTTQSISNTATESGWIGSGRAHSAAVRYFDGSIYEIIIEPSVLSDADRKIREGYLAHKWDELLGVTTLVDALTSDHPYKSAPPTV